jgi:hypothetical protein
MSQFSPSDEFLNTGYLRNSNDILRKAETMDQSKGYGGSKITTGSIVSEDIDLFSMLDTDPAILGGRTITFRPLSDNIRGPFEFVLSPQASDQYLQLKSIRLTGFGQITKTDGADFESTESVSVVNMFAASLFKAIDISINDMLVSDLSSALAPYQAYIQTIMSYNDSAQKTHLKGQMFHMDEADRFDTLTKDPTNTSNNSGFVTREKIVRGSRKFDFYIPLSSDILQSDRLLHPSASLKIKLVRQNDAFSLLTSSTDVGKVNLSNVRLHAHYVTVSPEIVKSHNTAMAKRPAMYPITRTVMREYNMGRTETSKFVTKMFEKELPKSIVVGMVSATAFHGKQDRNPFKFHHFDVTDYSLRVNGAIVPGDVFTPDFKNKLYMREYMEMYRNVGIDVGEDHGNAVTPELFASGCFFMAYDLTGHKCNMLHKHITATGQVDLNMVFKKALGEEVILIVYASFDAHVEVYKDNQVKVIYAK